MALGNKEMFEAFYEYCKNHTIEEVAKEWGGGEIYIPSYKSLYRNEEIYKDYQEGMSMMALKRKYDLSESRVRDIINGFIRQPSLFDPNEE